MSSSPQAPSGGFEWSSDRIRGLLDVAPDGVLIIDGDDVIVQVNPVALEHIGAPRSDVIGLPAQEFLVAFEGTSVPDHYERLRREGGSVEFEEYVPALGGWYRFFADTGALGDGMMLIFVREVTGHRLIERRARMLSAVGQAVGQTRTMGETLRAALAVVRSELEFDLAELWVAGMDAPRLLAVDHEEARTDLDTMVLEWVMARGQGPTASKEGLPNWPDLEVVAITLIPASADHPLMLRALRHPPMVVDDSASVLDASAIALGNILDQRRAQLEVEQFFELTREYVVIMTDDGRLRRVNPVVAESLGYDGISELIGLHIDEVIHPDDVEATRDNLELTVATGQPVERFVQRVLAADGSYRWISWNAQGSAEERMVFATGRDVTDERADRLQRHALDVALRGVLAGDPLPLTLGRFAEVVESTDRVSGCAIVLVEQDGSAGRPVLRVMAAASLPDRFTATFDGCEPDAAPGGIGAVILADEPVISVRLSADPRWASAHDVATEHGLDAVCALPLRGADDRVLGALVVAAASAEALEDVHWDKVHAVLGLAGLALESTRSVEALAVNEERFRIIAEVITDAVFERSADGRWTTDAFTTIFGHPIPDDGVDDEWWLERVHVDDRDDVRASLATAIDQGATTWEVEYRFARRDGEMADVRVRARLLRDHDGRMLSMLGGMLDVTERRELERQYHRALRVESLGTLAGGIAHDLNNSLSPIIMGAELMAEFDLDPEAADILDTISAAARRSAGMVRNILTYARGIDGPRRSVGVDELVSSVAKMVRDTFPKHIEVIAPLARSGLVVRGDPTQIHQVLMNLAVNARDAMPTGGTLRIAVDAVDDPAVGGADDQDGSLAGLGVGSFARIRVADSGTGMSAAVRQRIFEPFFTTKPRSEGTGLGLPTALSIARGHGGGLAVSTRPGRGTTVDLYLPLVDRSSIVDRGSPVVDEAGVDGRGTHGECLTVLVVDDEAAIRGMLRQMLESLGHRVVEASDGGEAVMALSGLDADVLLTDVMMPGLDGVELVETLREAGRTLPVIAMTGLTDDSRSLQFPEGSIAAMLAKPFDRAALIAALDTATAATT